MFFIFLLRFVKRCVVIVGIDGVGVLKRRLLMNMEKFMECVCGFV